MLTSKEIRSMAGNQGVYARGLRYYQTGKVSNVKITDHGEGMDAPVLAEAIVHGTEPYHTAVVLQGRNRRPSSWNCSCPAAGQYSGICKHTVALLTYLSEKGFGENDTLWAPKKKATDREAALLMERYLEQEKSRTASQLSGEVQLILILNFNPNYGKSSFRLKIGREKLYLVQNIENLVSDIHFHSKKQYGKDFVWNHDLTSLRAMDVPLVRFLQNLYEDKPYSAGFGRNSTEVSDGSWDSFWNAIQGRGTILLTQPKGEKTISLKEENPRLTIECQRQKDGGMEVTLPQIAVKQGREHLYCLQGDVLYRTDNAFQQGMQHLFLRPIRQLYIAPEQIPLFFSTVYPGISSFVEFVGDAELLEQYLPQHPELNCYLDSPCENTICARVEFIYGQETVNPYGKTTPTAHRSFGEEMAILCKLNAYFPRQEGDEVIGEWEEEDFYSFLTEVLPELSQLGEFFLSDKLKRMANPIHPRVKVGVSVENDLLSVRFQVSEFPKVELDALLSSYRQRRKFYRLKNGEFVNLQNSGLEELAELAETMELSPEDLQSEHFPLPLYRSLYVDAVLRRRDNLAYQRDEGFKALLRNMKNVEDSSVAVPDSLEEILRNYQKTGFRWLSALAGNGFHGILADDMGLGKTLQVLTLLQSHKEQTGSLRALVVCPASLVLNWKTEAEKFCPLLRTVALVGTAAVRQEAIASGEGEVLVTSYDQLKRDILHYKGKTFDYAVLDEAQTIKNAGTQAAKAAKSIVAKHRFALTGTPVENRLSELWSIFDFLMPGYLFTHKKFKNDYEIPGVKHGDKKVLERLRLLTAPFMLRRMKAQVLMELPPKVETVRLTELEGEQKKLYAAQLALARGELADAMESNNKLQILALLTRLRQICCDPSLLLEDYHGESSKLELCMELVQEGTDGGHKILLFSQFTSMLHLLQERLEQAKITYSLLEGATPKQQRQQMVENFQKGNTQVFLISLKAGGLGLNLTAADMVILYDPWWNMAAEQQAMDRAYRMGQTSRVQVYRLVCKDTIEEGILALQQKKKALGEAVISEGNAMQTMTAEDWKNLFREL